AAPVRGDKGQGGIVVYPYRGYGSRHEAFLMGRVLQQPATRSTASGGSMRRDAIDLGRRILRRGVGGATLVARLGGVEQRVTTDRDGYFRVHLTGLHLPPSNVIWHSMDLEVLDPAPAPVVAHAEVFVPPDSARFVVISDIDDTLMYTGVANKIRMMYNLFMQDAHSRVAFPGVAAFYRALHDGRSGNELNPMLYVSRGPWSIYEVLVAFFRMHNIPVGPILFLREWGLTLQRPLPQRAKDHKRDLIRKMLSLYDDLPFVLIGDSGQHDPELYCDVVREHPGRVLAAYIRNVMRTPARQKEIEALAEEVVAAGSALLLAADTFAMAEHAASRGLIAEQALPAVLEERRREQEKAPRKPREPGLKETAHVSGRGGQETKEAVAQGEVKEALKHEGSDRGPPNVLIEAEDAKTDKVEEASRTNR
ncbi:MAG: App1 family protein, partial [Rhodoplanes sp.]